MPYIGQAFFSAVGRLGLCAIFLLVAFGAVISDFDGALKELPPNIQLAKLKLAAATVLMIVGSLSVIFGYKARVGSVLLILVVLLANYYLPHDRFEAVQYQMFSIPLLSGLLFVLGNGAGPFSLDGQAAAAAQGESNWREAAESAAEPDAKAPNEAAATDEGTVTEAAVTEADETAGTDA